VLQEGGERARMIKALIIDKPNDFSNSLKLLIKGKGHKVFRAEDIIKAFFLLEKEEPHLVFFDLLFLVTPSGLRLLKRMKRTDRKRKIYLTCGPDAMGKELAKRIGADGAIFKPFEMGEIDKLIDKICEELE